MAEQVPPFTIELTVVLLLGSCLLTALSTCPVPACLQTFSPFYTALGDTVKLLATGWVDVPSWRSCELQTPLPPTTCHEGSRKENVQKR